MTRTAALSTGIAILKDRRVQRREAAQRREWMVSSAQAEAEVADAARSTMTPARGAYVDRVWDHGLIRVSQAHCQGCGCAEQYVLNPQVLPTNLINGLCHVEVVGPESGATRNCAGCGTTWIGTTSSPDVLGCCDRSVLTGLKRGRSANCCALTGCRLTWMWPS